MSEPAYWINTLNRFAEHTRQFPEIFKMIPNARDTNKIAVIVEPRKHHLLEQVLRNFAFYLAVKGWGLMIFHGNSNKEYVENIVRDWSYVELVELPVNNLSIADYNLLLTNSDFWRRIPAENILIFQTDTFIRNNNIDEFVAGGYDYIGAPWSWLNKCGNGGLSLRKRDAMIRVCDTVAYNGQPEDVYFSNSGIKVADAETGKRFSVESMHHSNSFGFHKPWGSGVNVEKEMGNFIS